MISDAHHSCSLTVATGLIYANCLEIWVPQLHGTLRVNPDRYRDCCTFTGFWLSSWYACYKYCRAIVCTIYLLLLLCICCWYYVPIVGTVYLLLVLCIYCWYYVYIVGTMYLLLVLCIYCWYYVSIVGTVYILLVLCIYCWSCVSIVGTMYLLSLLDAGLLFI
jgi:hypothetical protein